MYDGNLMLVAEDSAPVTSLPDRVFGTRAALFHILRERSDDDITTAREIVPINTLAHLNPTAKNFSWYSMLYVDDFVFCSAE